MTIAIRRREKGSAPKKPETNICLFLFLMPVFNDCCSFFFLPSPLPPLSVGAYSSSVDEFTSCFTLIKNKEWWLLPAESIPETSTTFLRVPPPDKEENED